MYDDHYKDTGGYVTGEVKLTIAIRLIASGGGYDLFVIFDVHFNYVKIICYHVLLIIS